ncbi:class I SAM-dependent methyltransferase [Lysobacter sp. Hz 25]|uniref:class I SAM-dependent methyltransferase n=1 Tax=Lysobacter sp. Hz 25 TaxID=3383698 RepID=UPI0038D47017
MTGLRGLLAPLARTPLHPQWLLGGRKAPAGLGTVRGRVLDIGAGDRWIQEHLAEQAHYVAVDHPGTGRSLYGARPDVFADGARLPFADGSFDAVVCLEVLEHARDPQGVLAELGRVLRPGGVAWLSMPFLYPIHDAPHDYQRFTEYGLRRGVEAAGLDLQSVERAQHALRSVGLLGCLAISGAAYQAPRWQWPLLLPLTAIAVLSINLMAWLGSFVWPDWNALSSGYSVKASKP